MLVPKKKTSKARKNKRDAKCGLEAGKSGYEQM